MAYEKIPATTTPAVPAQVWFYYETDRIHNSVSLRSSARANMVKDEKGEAQLDDVVISPQERAIVIEFLEEIIYELATAMWKITDGVEMNTFVNETKYISGTVISDTALYTTTLGVILDWENPIASPADANDMESGKVYVGQQSWWPNGSATDALVFMDDDNGGVKDLLNAVVIAPVVCSGFSIRDNAAFNSNVLPSIDKKMENCIRYFILSEWYTTVGMDKDMQLCALKYQQNFIKVKNLTNELRKPLMT